LEPERNTPSADRVAKPSSLGDVARRISSRTTDFLAICIVLVASLTLGRQILHWWHAEPPSPTAASDAENPAPAWDDELQPLSLEFGDLPVALTRQVVIGDQKAAVEALVRHCQAAAEMAERPSHSPDETERRLLAKIGGLTPIAEEPGDWQVFVVDERFTLVAAVRRFPENGAGDSPAGGQAGRLHHNNDGSRETARGVVRLVCWGLAMPARENAWTLYLFRESPAGSASPAGLRNAPLPPGAQRNLSVRDERGGLVLGFSGSGSAQIWMKFYDDWFLRQGWSKTDTWSTGAGAWSASFTPLREPLRGKVEIRLAADHDGNLTGLLQSQ
jgi:hypothetical protein